MPLKRTPPTPKPPVSETESERVDGCTSDIQSTERNISVNVGRLKRKRENELTGFMEEVRVMFSKFVSEQNGRLDTLELTLTEIKSQNEIINLSMSTLSSKYDDLRKELESFKRDRKEHISYIKQLESKVESFERQSCATKIEIRNIPKIPNENKEILLDTVKKMSTVLNLPLQTADIKDIYRPFAKSDTLKPVIVELNSVLVKENLLHNLKKLSLEEKRNKLNTGIFDSHVPKKPIFISESLTAKGRRLFFLARDFAGSYDYAYCWTTYGKIYLRKKEGMPHIRIQEESDLAKLKMSLV